MSGELFYTRKTDSRSEGRWVGFPTIAFLVLVLVLSVSLSFPCAAAEADGSQVESEAAADVPAGEASSGTDGHPGPGVADGETDVPSSESAADKESTSRPDGPIVQAIRIEGANLISEEVIREQITHVKIGEVMVADDVLADLEAIYELGYFERRALRAEPLPVGEGRVELVFYVQENPPVQSVTVEGLDEVRALEGVELTEADITSVMGLEKGRPLPSPGKYRDKRRQFTARIWEKHGVYLLYVDDKITSDGRVTIEVQPVKVNEIKITGNDKTHEQVIRREFRLSPGEVLTAHDLRLTLERLGRTGYFKSIEPLLHPADDPFSVNIELRLEERRTGEAVFGAAYTSAEGLVGYVDVSDRNFLGYGKDVGIRWEFGKNKNNYDLRFYEPYLNDAGTSFGINLYKKQLAQKDAEDNDYRQNVVGGTLTLGHPISDSVRVSLKYKAENSSLVWDEPEEEDYERVRSLTLTGQADTTDDFFYPSKGMRLSAAVETAGRFLGGDAEFTKCDVYGSVYRSLFGSDGKHTIALRAMGGVGLGELPLQEVYRVGGSETLRGYAYGELQGDRRLVLNAEYRWRLTDILHAVVFYDAGSAWSSPDQLMQEGLKQGYGIGLRVEIPVLGIIRVDYGVGEQGGRTYFSLGQAF